MLLNTEILIEEEDKKSVTAGGLLLFCTNPNRFLSQAGSDAVAYPGKEENYVSKERLSIGGPMMVLLGKDGIIEKGCRSIMEQYRIRSKTRSFLQ